MNKFFSGSLASLAILVLAGCSDSVPTQVSEAEATPLSAANGANVVASASAGAQYTLVCCGGLVIDQTLNLTAQKDADGNVKGILKYTQSIEAFSFEGRWVADVTCMNVYDGNRVKVGGIITQSNDPDEPVGGYIWVHSIDNGQGTPDQTSGAGFGNNAENEAFCDSPAPPNLTFLSTVSHGNIVVRG